MEPEVRPKAEDGNQPQPNKSLDASGGSVVEPSVEIGSPLEANDFWRFQETKTKGSKRVVTIPPSLGLKLMAHKRVQSERRLKLGSEWQAHDLVFCGEFGTPLSLPNLTYRYFRPILTAAGIP